MSYRFMRVIVFFDLPTTTKNERREYNSFRKHLIKNGFIMMQESVYSKLALNQNAAAIICDNVKKYKPPAGIVTITEKQFSKMEMIVGKISSNVVSTDERIVVI